MQPDSPFEKLTAPIGWRYRVLVDKHPSSGPPLPGQVSMLDISHQAVWGTPGQWRYSDGPAKPQIDWVCDAEPLYGAPAEPTPTPMPDALRQLEAALRQADAAVWDKHYGNGLSVEYARASHREIYAALLLLPALTQQLQEGERSNAAAEVDGEDIDRLTRELNATREALAVAEENLESAGCYCAKSYQCSSCKAIARIAALKGAPAGTPKGEAE